MRRLEDQYQIALFQYLAKAYPAESPWFTHSPNGGLRNVVVATQLKRAGVRRGVPDVLYPRHRGGFAGLAIELKAKGGRPTPEQLAWLDMLAREGWMTAVCVGLDAAIQTVDAYMRMQQAPGWGEVGGEGAP